MNLLRRQAEANREYPTLLRIGLSNLASLEEKEFQKDPKSPGKGYCGVTAGRGGINQGKE